ncbi:phosphoribosyl-ATP diphosphatase [Hyphococcus lacteus]|uniref:Phosphoribosyl-ATP pyrophosphatase n=1 Tax=Hyphococcus lacteus TaxID=3143536 RepID=A0ABV3Z1X0_9PROT
MTQYKEQLGTTLDRLAETIDVRKGAAPESSYTASLLTGGAQKCAKKFGEESFEFALAAVTGDKQHIAEEAADVLYHFMVLLSASGVSTDKVSKILAHREGMSGHEEKSSRT